MLKILALLVVVVVVECKSVFDFVVKDANENDFELRNLKGHVLLIVNVASQCLYVDDHYESLVPLQIKYASENFTVLAFPCNQFGQQEIGTNAEIQKFVRSRFSVNFPVLAKVEVLSGEGQSDLWKFLGESAGEPQWNFWKYLVNRNGEVIGSWNERVRVRSIESNIRRALSEKPGPSDEL